MRKKQASLTAAGIAMLRALESEKPAGERVIFDPYARRFVPNWLYWSGKFFTSIGYAEWRGPGVQGFLAARERFIDEVLEAAIRDGLQELVILGAGFDARPYRFQEHLKSVKVFEVDHPATQAIKIARLKEILGQMPPNVAYVAIDFNHQSLEDILPRHGWEPALTTLFIWQGVTQYLAREAVECTLAFVRRCSGPGSAIVFDYIDRAVLDKPGRHGEVSNLRRYHRLTGESLTFGLTQIEVKAFLESRGFTEVKNVTASDLQSLYFSSKPRPVSSGYGIAYARVPG